MTHEEGDGLDKVEKEIEHAEGEVKAATHAPSLDDRARRSRKFGDRSHEGLAHLRELPCIGAA